ncbi:MAG: metal-dependent phosphohydrolase [Curvibacter sp. RIFCSPHIGHO2_12_FULL_63_18]|uniref:HD-GYP domain-containing protein n=1 Tax=Rhodoferax sp. TaxID=50421 RepID=UPI0008C8BC8F|nr:HD domain-containing phosphohydrolase [Rhodoferax sp.]OGO95090.1 MAG: metal-dependent phosphohydrolase [Curvibacter sp. GWA2_63_95]OGP05279.1 MAG: metal-dependent phosphohydrolase [Curvibacter sp. RIFCSPHIGHO2_12_FULL_63_18]HCX80077.1 metal-dependent phosphohydrolase [Rhodoferax sp.]
MTSDTTPSTVATTLDPADALRATQVVVFALATLSELRDSDTESHMLRVQRYVRALCAQLQTQPAHAEVLTPTYVEMLLTSVPIYDMGTVGIPDRILLKPGRLTPDEVAIMRTHTTLGHDALARAEKTLGHVSPLLTLAKEITLCHQEKWDGSGYPKGLWGAQIPLSARIVALADVYDALISNKVYKDGVSHERAVEILTDGRGAHFDPDVVDAFLQIHEDFRTIAQRHADTDADMQQKIEYMANAIAEVAVL